LKATHIPATVLLPYETANLLHNKSAFSLSYRLLEEGVPMENSFLQLSFSKKIYLYMCIVKHSCSCRESY